MMFVGDLPMWTPSRLKGSEQQQFCKTPINVHTIEHPFCATLPLVFEFENCRTKCLSMAAAGLDSISIVQVCKTTLAKAEHNVYRTTTIRC